MLRRTLDDSFAEAIRRDITTVTTARLCVNALFRYIGPFLAVVADGLDVSVAELGVALTVAQVCGFASPAIGRLVDHLPRRRSIALGLAGAALGGVVVATCSGIVWFTVGLLAISTFNIVLVVGTGSWIADHVPFAQRSRVVGLNEMSWALGLLIGGAAAAPVSARRTSRDGAGFDVVAVPTAVMVLAAVSFLAVHEWGVPGMALIGVFIGAFEFCIVSLIPIGAELVPGLPGRGLGLMMGAATMGRAITTIPTTWLYDNVGIAASAALAAGWATLAAAAMIVRMRVLSRPAVASSPYP